MVRGARLFDLASIDLHGEAVAWAEGDLGLGLRLEPGQERELEARQDRREQQRGLHAREPVADALPGADGERQVGRARPRGDRLLREALRVEALGVREEPRVAASVNGAMPIVVPAGIGWSPRRSGPIAERSKTHTGG